MGLPSNSESVPWTWIRACFSPLGPGVVTGMTAMDSPSEPAKTLPAPTGAAASAAGCGELSNPGPISYAVSPQLDVLLERILERGR